MLNLKIEKKYNVRKNEEGVSLVITFLVTTIMLSLVLNLSAILFSQTKITSGIGDAVSALYAAESGAEKTLYFDRKEVPAGAQRGICDICNSCSPAECANCTLTPLPNIATGDCNANSCTSCMAVYDFSYEGKTYTVNSRVVPDGATSVFYIYSKGIYKDTTRAVELVSAIP